MTWTIDTELSLLIIRLGYIFNCIVHYIIANGSSHSIDLQPMIPPQHWQGHVNSVGESVNHQAFFHNIKAPSRKFLVLSGQALFIERNCKLSDYVGRSRFSHSFIHSFLSCQDSTTSQSQMVDCRSPSYKTLTHDSCQVGRCLEANAIIRLQVNE